LTDVEEKTGREGQDDWDLEDAEIQRPVVKPRAVVSVSFSSGELAVVHREASRRGVRASKFIREAAMKEAESASTALILFQGHSAGAFSVAFAFRDGTSVPAPRDLAGDREMVAH